MNSSSRRWLAFLGLITLAVPACAEDDAFLRRGVLKDREDDDDSYTGGSGGAVVPPFVIEDPDANTGILMLGQSSSIGVCSPPGDLCAPINTSPRVDAWQVCHGGISNDTYSGQGLGALDNDLPNCARGTAEQPAYAMVDTYRRVAGEPGPDTITCWPGQAGTSISELSRGSPYYTRMLSCIQEATDEVAASPATYGGNGNFVVRGAGLIQCETDDINGNTDGGYTADVLTFVDELCEDVQTITGQTGCPEIVWYQCSGFTANGDQLAITGPQLLDAALVRSNLHVLGPTGHYNPEAAEAGVPGQYAGGLPSSLGANTFIAWEHNGTSTLHFTNRGHMTTGARIGKWLARVIHEPGIYGTWKGLRITRLFATNNVLTVCYDGAIGGLQFDNTTCPGHWNGNWGLEWYHEQVGVPNITDITQNGNCLDVTLSHPPQDFGTMNVGARGLFRLSQSPANGCRDFQGITGPVGGVNPGTPGWTNLRDDDTSEQLTDPDTPSWNTPIIEFRALDSGGVPAPADTSPAYLTLSDATEYVDFGDATPDPFVGSTGLTVLVNFEPTGVDGSLVRRWPTFDVAVDANGSGNSRPRFLMNTGGIFSATSQFTIPENDGFKSLIVTWDGSRPLGDRVRFVTSNATHDGCIELGDTEAGAFPTVLADDAASLRIGNSLGASHVGDHREVAVWNVAATSQQMLELCRARLDVRGTSLGTPLYYVRPECDDDPTVSGGMVNLGSVPVDGTGINMELADITVDQPGECNGSVPDAGVSDSGPPADAGFAPTVPNQAAVALDGDDYLTVTDPDLLSGETDAAVCLVIRQNLRSDETILGHWEGGSHQWRWTPQGRGARFWVSTSGAAEDGYLGDDAAEALVVPNKPALHCSLYDLGNATVADRIRHFRNGSEVSLPDSDAGPPGAFFNSTGGTISIGANADGTNATAEVEVDEVAIWVGADTPTAAEIQAFSVDADDWECSFPNWDMGVAGVEEPSKWFRFELDYTDTMGGPTLTTSGDPTFVTTRICDDVFRTYTALAPDGTDSWTTSNMVQDLDIAMSFCIDFRSTTNPTEAQLVGQRDSTGLSGTNSWGLIQRGEDFRVYVATSGTDVGTYVDFTGPGAIVEDEWNNVCVELDMSQPAQLDRARLVLNGAEMTTKAVTGTLPGALNYEAGGVTTFAANTNGTELWGGAGAYLSHPVFWREQDGEPTFTELLNDVGHDPTVSGAENPPEYDEITGVPIPGCWFTLDGTLDDRLQNCSTLSAADDTVWPSPADSPGPTPSALPAPPAGGGPYTNTNCAQFNGTDALIDVAGGLEGIHNQDAWTFCYWENESNQNTDSNEVIMGNDAAPASFAFVRDVFDQNRFLFPFGNSGDEPNATRLNGAWIHACYRFDSAGGTNADRFRIFMIDDDASATLAADCSPLLDCEQTVGVVGNIPSAAITNTFWRFGGDNSVPNTFWGANGDSRLDDVVIWPVALSDADIESFMDGTAQTPDADGRSAPAHWYPFNGDPDDDGTEGSNGANVNGVTYPSSGCPPAS